MKISSPLLSLADSFRTIAREELIPRHGKLRDDQIHRHSDGSLFTEADLAAEKRLNQVAKEIYPNALSTGEEEITENPKAFLEMAQTSDVLIFDPIDGTGAFKSGRDTYGMMGAYIRNGTTQGGIIYTPEKDIMIIVERGNGCWIIQNGQISTAIRANLENRPHTLTDHAKIAFACRNQDADYEALLAKDVEGYLPRNNSSYDYTLLLTGATDATFYSEGFNISGEGEGKCPPWDHAAGVLAIQESGGYSALPYGAVTNGGESYTPLFCHDRLLVASSRELFDDVMSHLSARAPELMSPRPR